MITGGTGSFGNVVLRRLLKYDVGQVIIYSRDEKKQEDMRIEIRDSRLKFIIGDVRDYESVKRAMNGVDFVFHAAALKQVPVCEFYPIEAVRTNVLGTENVLNAAIEQSVSRLVVLSTDKAVYPINAMGISKAMAEKAMVAKARGLHNKENITFCATRYGNVMGSRGSVIPLFIEKIKSGSPLRITDPRMTRFLMSLEESVDLVFHAFEHGNQGDIFVQKAPACSIENLANALIQLFGKKVPIEVIGTRHGEKLYESLVSREEMAKIEDLGSYYRIPADNRDLNYELYITQGNVDANDVEDYTSENTRQLNVNDICELLLKLDFVVDELNSLKSV